jgi:HMG (high mobility group) box
VREKNDYKGEWNLPKRRAKKHPLAPKRPMSAFLKYSQNKRSDVKEQNPSMSNTDVSRLLGEMWRNASDDERQPYVDEEQVERANYNERIKEWREEQGKIDASTRKSHHSVPKIQRNESSESKQSNEKRSRYDASYARSAMADARSSRSYSVQQDRNVFRPYDGMYDNRNVNMSPHDTAWNTQHHHHHRPHAYYPYNYPKMTPTLTMPNQEEHPSLLHSSSLSTDSSRGNSESTPRNDYRSRSPLYPYQQPPPTMQQQSLKPYEPIRNSRETQVYEKPQLRGPSPPPHPPQDYRPNQQYDQYRMNSGESMNYSNGKSPTQSTRPNSHQYYENFYNLP